MVDASCVRSTLGCDQSWIRLTNTRSFTAQPDETISIDIGDGLTASPDGRKLAFVAQDNAGGYLGNRDIYVLDVAECRQTPGGCTRTEFARLTTDPGRDINPAWSPDGQSIAFASEQGGGGEPAKGYYGHSSLFIMRPDGSARQRLVPWDALGFTGQMLMPTWSPDGRRLAFHVNNLDKLSSDGMLYTVERDGSHLQSLAATIPPALAATPQTGRRDFGANYTVASDPHWSPDGKVILAWAVRDGTISAYLLDAAGTEVRRLPGSPQFPSWSPDGQQILFQGAASPETGSFLFTMNRDGTQVRRLNSKEPIGMGIWVKGQGVP
jgi:Tol biopolymer transport system component